MRVTNTTLPRSVYLNKSIQPTRKQPRAADTPAVRWVIIAEQSWRDRLMYARDYAGEIVGRAWPYVVGRIAVGALIHGYAPQNVAA